MLNAIPPIPLRRPVKLNPRRYKRLATASVAAVIAALLAACAAEDQDAMGPGSGAASGKFDDVDDGSTGGSDGALDDDGSGDDDGGSSGGPDAEPDPNAALFEAARDVTVRDIAFDPDAPPPESYTAPSVPAVSLGGTEFWQRWSGGHSPTFSFYEGTDAGRKCMQASAIRFEAIMKEAPAKILELQMSSNWSGSFFNWNDDYSQSTWSGSGPRLWAWRTGLIKWISSTTADGKCQLPTLEMVESLAANCLESSRSGDGEIQGCTN